MLNLGKFDVTVYQFRTVSSQVSFDNFLIVQEYYSMRSWVKFPASQFWSTKTARVRNSNDFSPRLKFNFLENHSLNFYIRILFDNLPPVKVEERMIESILFDVLDILTAENITKIKKWLLSIMKLTFARNYSLNFVHDDNNRQVTVCTMLFKVIIILFFFL